MNILLTNDDGWSAPGLHAAFDALRGMGSVHVVAPSSERSACSHMITLKRPITVERTTHERIDTIHAVDGTPADCVRLAFAGLVQGPIDAVVAGINRGANAGVDSFYSGTVAAAREGAILGIPSIAVSQAIRRDVETDWAAASDITAVLVRQLITERLPGPGFWSVNLPAPLPTDPKDHVRRVPITVDPQPITFDRKEDGDGRVTTFTYGASYWLREVTSPSDYSTIRDGDIAVTAIPLVGRF